MASDILLQIYYFIRTALASMRNHAAINVLAVGTIAIVLFLLSGFMLVADNLDRSLDSWRKRIQIVAFIEKGVGNDKISEMRDQLETLPGIIAIEFLSSRRALEIFREDMDEFAGVLEGLDTNPLPASFEIRVGDDYMEEDAIAGLAESVVAIDGIEDVQYGQRWIERFAGFLRLVNMVGYFIGGLLLFSTILIISNTIRFTIIARSEEIAIMRLVGATELFVRVPFLIEGAMVGLFGSVGCLILLRTVFWYVAPQLESGMVSAFGESGVVFLPASTQASLVLGGTLLGLIGSFTNIGRLRENR